MLRFLVIPVKGRTPSVAVLAHRIGAVRYSHNVREYELPLGTGVKIALGRRLHILMASGWPGNRAMKHLGENKG